MGPTEFQEHSAPWRRPKHKSEQPGSGSAIAAASKAREWGRRVDPFACIVSLIAAVVYSLHGFNGALSRDLAVYSYGAQQVADGVPPYVSILTRAGPLGQLIPAIGVAGARAGGFDDLLGMRLLYMVIAVACVCSVYLLGRDLFASPLAGLAAAFAFLSMFGFIEYASNGPREKTPMVLFLVCALLAVTRQRWFAAGFAVGLATLVWQPAFFVAMAAMLVAPIALRLPERIRALVHIAMGGFVAAALCLLYFALAGALKAFIDAYLLLNVEYTALSPLTRNLPKNWARLENGYGASLWVILVGLVMLASLTLSAIRRGNLRVDRADASVVAVGAASFVGLIWTFRNFTGWPDAFVLLPLAAVGIGGMAKRITARLSLKAALSLTLAWVVATVGAAVTYSVTQRDHGLGLQRDSVEAILGPLPRDASILSIEAPEALVLSGKTNPTRHQMFPDGLARYIDDTWAGGLEGFAAWVRREEPTIIALGSHPFPPWLVETIKSEYWRVGRAPGWIWYVHRSVGPDVLSEARQATQRRASDQTPVSPS